MKIAFITTTLTTGGAEVMLLKLLTHLDRKRFEPTVISLSTKGKVGPQIEALGIPVLALDMNHGWSNFLKLMELVSYLRNTKPDLVQTWMYHADLLGGLAARLAGCKAVVWGLRNSNLDEQLTKRSTLWVVRACSALSAWLPHWILSCSTKGVAVHAAAGYRLEKMRVIPNGFDFVRFQPDDEARKSVRIELGLQAFTPLVGLIARYDAQKNHVGFIEAAVLIHRQIPTAHFVLSGGGIDNCNTALNETIKAHGLGPYFHLLGCRDDMPRLMASLDVLASTSHGEAFPNVLGEAMACGVPCVVTDVGDSADIVRDTGRVVQSGDMKELARNIVILLRLIPEEKLALSKKARERVKKHYGIEHVARLYGIFYEQLLKTK